MYRDDERAITLPEHVENDPDYGFNLYRNKPEVFQSLTLLKRAYLAENSFNLTKAIITNPNATEEDIIAITATFGKIDPSLRSNRYFDTAIERKTNAQRQEIANLLSAAPRILARLDQHMFWAYACLNVQLVPSLLARDQQVNFPDYAISKIAAISATRPSEADNNICFLMLEKKFLDRLNPAARILVFSKIKQIANVAPYIDRFAALPEVLKAEINQSYSLPLDGTLNYWIPAITGVGGYTFVEQFDVVFLNALGKGWENLADVNRPYTPAEARSVEALAMILIQDPRFINGWTYPYAPDCVSGKLKTAERLQLGLLYRKVAYQLLMNPTYQGSGGFGHSEKAQLVEKHVPKGNIDPTDYLGNWFKTIHDQFNKTDKRVANSTVCQFYEQHQNFVNGRAVDFHRVPSLRNLGAHAFLKSRRPGQLPAEVVELINEISEFENTNFRLDHRKSLKF